MLGLIHDPHAAATDAPDNEIVAQLLGPRALLMRISEASPTRRRWPRVSGPLAVLFELDQCRDQLANL